MGNTPYHFAVLNGSTALVHALEEYNGNAMIKNNNEVTAIDLSVEQNHKELRLYFRGNAKYKDYDYAASH